MNPEWRSFLESRGATFTGEGELNFAAPADEAAAAAGQTIVAPLAHLALIACAGADARSFLNNQLSNDLRHLEPGRAQIAAWCTAKGRMLASFVVWAEAEADSFLLQLSADLAEATRKRLQMFVLRSKVVLSETDRVLLGLAGPQAEEIAARECGSLPVDVMAMMRHGDVAILRQSENRLIVALPAAQAPALWDKFSAAARPVGTAAWQWGDIRAGLPLITAATREEFVPQMANLDLIGGLSFNKGCYPGQEIVARAHYLGKVKRRMYLARCGSSAAPGTPLYAPETGDQACGMVVNAAPAPQGGTDLLAVIQSSCAEAGEVRAGAADGPSLELAALPYSV